MDRIINGLLTRYESGAMSRRELVGALAVLSVGGGSAFAAAPGFESAAINHVSIVVSDLQKSVDFYQKVFGLKFQSENKAQQLVQLYIGKSQHLSIRQGTGQKGADHFAIGIDGFNKDAVAADLRARGATPSETGGAGFHVNDPDGYPVQLIANT